MPTPQLSILKTTCIFLLLSSKTILSSTPLQHYLKKFKTIQCKLFNINHSVNPMY